MICEGCGNEIDEGDALNGYCYLCVEEYHQLQDAADLAKTKHPAPDANPNPWVEYQPDRERDKEIYDIELRDGTIVQGCYPNGVHWNPMFSHVFGPTPKQAGKGPIADYRVVRIRRSHPDPFGE